MHSHKADFLAVFFTLGADIRDGMILGCAEQDTAIKGKARLSYPHEKCASTVRRMPVFGLLA